VNFIELAPGKCLPAVEKAEIAGHGPDIERSRRARLTVARRAAYAVWEEASRRRRLQKICVSAIVCDSIITRGRTMTEKTSRIVTGGSRGIGAAIVKQLAKAGVHVVAAARGLDKLNAVVDEVKAAGG